MKRFLSLAFVFLAPIAVAQESRSTITGHVSDPTGAIVVLAHVNIINSDTGVKTTVRSNSAGDFTVPYLPQGHYEVRVDEPGFRSYVHTGLTLQSEQTVMEDIVLPIGNATETVTVHSEASLVDVSTANTSQELTAEEVEELPSFGRSPLGFAHMEYGAVAKGKHSMSETRPFDNSVVSDFGLSGGSSSSNELLLNGAPNMEDGGRTAAFSPELDAVDAIHADEFSANADLGDTAGGIVNITTKPGTNQFHGSASEYYDGSRPFQAQQYGFGVTPTTRAVSTHFNQFAGTIGGPVWIPHVFDGHNKLFFFYAFEGYIGNSPFTGAAGVANASQISSVPTTAERMGDFSALLALSTATPNPYQLYNPYTATEAGGVITRTPITGNILSNAGLSVNSVAQAYMALLPQPNYNGPSTTADGQNNYFADPAVTNNYKSSQARIDYNVNSSNSIFADFHYSNYVNSTQKYFTNVLTGVNADAVNLGGQLDDVQRFSSTLDLETRLSYSRYESSSLPASTGIDPSSKGFASYISSTSTSKALPAITFSDASSIASLSSAPGNIEDYNNLQLYSSLTKVWGRHTFKVGPDIRTSKESLLAPGAANGTFAFSSGNGDFVTSGNQASAAKQTFGGAYALFDLGIPTTGSYAVDKGETYSNWYTGGFAQDDWKALHNLTVSLGVRVEHETPVVEGDNQLVTGWNPTATNAVTAQSATNYAAAPNPILAASAFTATGGVEYATSSHRSPYPTSTAYVSPRVGFSYSPGFSHDSLAIRGGAGLYYNPLGDYDFSQSYGFSQTSNLTTTYDSGLNPANPASDPILVDPFPTGTVAGTTANPILLPNGSSLGANAQLGSTIAYYDPDTKAPYSIKWTLDIQKQFGRSWMIEAGYVGVHQVHNTFTNNISAVPEVPLLSQTATAADAATITAEMANPTANPFKGLFPTAPNGVVNPTGTNYQAAKTLTGAQLIAAYPEYQTNGKNFAGVSESLIPAVGEKFNALLFRVQKRMSNGLEFFLNYQWSRQLGNTTQLNPGGPLWYGETTSDFPQHFALALTYDLPFGKGQPFANHSGLLDELIGGYKVTSLYEYDSGTPIQWSSNLYNYTGNWKFSDHPHDWKTASFDTSGFDTTSGANDQPGAYNFRTFPEYLLRTDPTKNTNISVLKNFTVWERVVVQPRFDAFNAFNRHQLNTPNLTPTSASFGFITSQLNTGRNMEMGVHLLF